MVEKVRALIVDDEASARMALRGVLEAHFSEVEIVGEAKNVPDAVKEIIKTSPHVIFLDIEMPGYSGLEILDFFDEQQFNSKIVFVTAYQNFALQAFELAAVDYILKPVSYPQIKRALDRIAPINGEHLEALKTNLEIDQPKKIAISTSTGMEIISLEDILYFKADGSYTKIHLKNGEKFTTSKRLSGYEKIMNIGRFFRTHRSFIVNLDHIVRIGRDSGDYVVMLNGDELLLSGEKKSQLYKAFQSGKL